MARKTPQVPTVLTHAVSGIALGSTFRRSAARVWFAGALCAALPDVDVIGFRFGIRYGDLLGHRGLTHSLAFAAVLASELRWVWAPSAVLMAIAFARHRMDGKNFVSASGIDLRG
jgi:inner membrane protein